MGKVWLYSGLLALVAGASFAFYESRATEGRRLEQEIKHTLVQRKVALDSTVQAKHTLAVVDQRGTVAEAHRLTAQSKVRVVRPDTLRITTDTAVFDLPVPVEVTQLIVADSGAIAALRSQVAARDTVILRQDTVIALDSVVIIQQDSLIHVRPKRNLLKVAAVGAVVLVVGRELVKFFVR